MADTQATEIKPTDVVTSDATDVEQQNVDGTPVVPADPAKEKLANDWRTMGNPAAKQKLSCWQPEDEEFWNTWGSKIAWKNLMISIPNLLLMFATWLMWSIVATTIQTAHDKDPTAYAFTDMGLDPTDKKGYKATLFMVPALAGFSGATLRVVNTFMVAIAGGQAPNAMNSTLAIIPMAGIGIALANKSCPFWALCILAPMSGFGGGAFASSMSAISFFFPKKKQGVALGMNAGLGNLGVSVTQFMMPLVTSAPVFGIGAIGEKYVANGGWFFVILLALAATPAWLFKNYMPMHGSPTGSTIMNLGAYLRLTLPGFIGIAVGIGIFLGLQPVVKGKPALLILRIVLVAIVACLVAGTSLYLLAGKAIQTKLKAQSIIFKNKHTFWFTILYIMTFGSFIGYSSAFPLIIKNVFGYLPNGDKNPNAPAPGSFAWMGPFVGSLARIAGGFGSDKLGPQGGAIVTHWGTIIEVVATVLAGVFTGLAMNADTPETYFVPFLISFLFLFGSTGSSNGSTFRQMSVSFPPEEAGPVLGWTSAIAAYGAAIFPACFGAGVEGDFVDKVFYFLASYYFICLIVNYWFYYRKNAELPC